MLFLMSHDINDNVTPISVNFPGLVKREEIDSEALFVNIRPIKKSVDEITDILDNNHLNDYIYLMDLRVSGVDPDRLVLTSLDELCNKNEILHSGPDAIIYHFSDCLKK
jgi:hypothetical protein